MGWNSAGEIFDPVAAELLNTHVTPDEMTRVLVVLIKSLQMGDWDTEGESLDLFRNDPAIVEAFAQCDIFLGSDPRHPDHADWRESEDLNWHDSE